MFLIVNLAFFYLVNGQSCNAYGLSGQCVTTCTSPSASFPSLANFVTGCENVAGDCCIQQPMDPSPGPAVITIAGAGDTCLATTSPTPPTIPTASIVPTSIANAFAAADLSFVNLETSCCQDSAMGTSKCGPGPSTSCYAFHMPIEWLSNLTSMGIDLVSIANNHAEDFGDSCRSDLEPRLTAINIGWSGPPGTTSTKTVNGLRVGFVAFSYLGYDNLSLNFTSVASLVTQTKANNDIVVVSVHGGAEGADYTRVPLGFEYYYGENRGDMRTFAHTVIDAGADLMLAHGPHVLRGMELYKGRLLAYSLGNFATYGKFALSGDTALAPIVIVSLDKNGLFVSAQVIENVQAEPGGPMPGAGAFAKFQSLSALDFPLSRLTFDPTSLSIGRLSDGAALATVNTNVIQPVDMSNTGSSTSSTVIPCSFPTGNTGFCIAIETCNGGGFASLQSDTCLAADTVCCANIPCTPPTGQAGTTNQCADSTFCTAQGGTAFPTTATYSGACTALPLPNVQCCAFPASAKLAQASDLTGMIGGATTSLATPAPSTAAPLPPSPPQPAPGPAGPTSSGSSGSSGSGGGVTVVAPSGVAVTVITNSPNGAATPTTAMTTPVSQNAMNAGGAMTVSSAISVCVALFALLLMKN